MNCLFCKIINGEMPSKTIYEDDLVKVFLDIYPSTNGDMLIVPKKHYKNILDIDKDLIPHMHNVILKLYNLLKEKLSIIGLTLVQNNGHGQVISHYHIHVIPRYINDDFGQTSNENLLVDIENVYEQIKS